MVSLKIEDASSFNVGHRLREITVVPKDDSELCRCVAKAMHVPFCEVEPGALRYVLADILDETRTANLLAFRRAEDDRTSFRGGMLFHNRDDVAWERDRTLFPIFRQESVLGFRCHVQPLAGEV